ncbi:MAG: hypothetical protein GKS02_11205 [Alphaproteobacteria bacterium]|nr:hypothetical protein [Alphaproteobacteria bacterium]
MALLLAACTSAPPQTNFPRLTYTHLGAFDLDVSKIEIVDGFKSSLAAPNVAHMMPVAPAAAARRWAEDRLRAAGSSGRRAVFTIDNGVVTETVLKRESGFRGALTVDQSERYDAVVAVRLEIFDLNGRRLAEAQAQARRTRTVPENITLNVRDKVWFSITEALTKDLNTELDSAIPQFLGQYMR